TALFERLREANILLQEVLSGSHANMSEIETTLVSRVTEFSHAVTQVAQQAGATNQQVEQHVANFKQASAQTLTDLGQLAAQFDSHGRALAEAVSLIDRSNRRTEGALNERRESLETLAGMLDSRSGELEERLARFSGQLDGALSALARTVESRADDLDQ